MKNAVLGERGWYNPDTNELLLGRRTPDWVLEELALRAAPVEVAPVADTVTDQGTEQAAEEVVTEGDVATPPKRSRKKKADDATPVAEAAVEAPAETTTTQEA